MSERGEACNDTCLVFLFTRELKNYFYGLVITIFWNKMMTDGEAEIKLRQVYRELKSKFGIDYRRWLGIIISSRLKSSNGRCSRQRNNITGKVFNCKITMSRALLDEFGWEQFEQTFRHEVAHLANSITGGKKHDISFKRLCKLFGGTMNGDIAGSEFSECATTDFVKVIKKWLYTCPCGYQRKMVKRMSNKKRGSHYYICGSCKVYTLDTWQEKRIG